jgi:hypothetical protein
MKNQTAPLGVSSSIDGGQPYGGSLDELYILGWSLNPVRSRNSSITNTRMSPNNSCRLTRL